jgi:amidophosphoribosyltransferase
VFADLRPREAPNLTYLGLHALQHRGQESAGIATVEARQRDALRAPRDGPRAGHASARRSSGLPGDRGHRPRALLHRRGARTSSNAQPFAVEHGGVLARRAPTTATSPTSTRSRPSSTRGAIFQTSTDTEVFLHLFARAPQGPVVDRIVHALSQARRAPSPCSSSRATARRRARPARLPPALLGILNRRPRGRERAHGLRPHRRRVPARHRARRDGRRHPRGRALAAPVRARRPSASCVFEHVYFARPDSMLGGRERVRGAQAHGPHPRRGAAPSTPTWSSPCPTAASRRHRLRRGQRACPSRWASSAATTSAARSSSPRSPSATSACG